MTAFGKNRNIKRLAFTSHAFHPKAECAPATGRAVYAQAGLLA